MRAYVQGNKGVTLLELMAAMLVLAMVSTMVYSALHTGISFADKGENKILAMQQELGFLTLLQRQVNGAWYDPDQNKIMLSADDDLLWIVTRQPIIHHNHGLVLAIYRYDDVEQKIYYTEKKDFYNLVYIDRYLPAFNDMLSLVNLREPLVWFHEQKSGMLTVSYGENKYNFLPKSGKIVK